MDAEARKAIGLRIKRLREARGLTQPALGALTGIDYQLISKHERGIHAPDWPGLLAYAKALDSSAEYLSTGADATTSTVASPAIVEYLSRHGGEVTVIEAYMLGEERSSYGPLRTDSDVERAVARIRARRSGKSVDKAPPLKPPARGAGRRKLKR